MRLHIQNPYIGNKLTLDVSASAKIKDVKKEIQLKTCLEEPQLTYCWTLLDDDEMTLQGYNIDGESALYIYTGHQWCGCGLFNQLSRIHGWGSLSLYVTVFTQSGLFITFSSMSSYSTVQLLKGKIQKEKGIPVPKQHLYHKGIELGNGADVPQVDFHQKIMLKPYPTDGMTILVKSPKKTFAVSVRPSDTIAQVKDRIQILEEISLVQQHLEFKGNELDNAGTVSSAEIQEGTTINMHFDSIPQKQSESNSRRQQCNIDLGELLARTCETKKLRFEVIPNNIKNANECVAKIDDINYRTEIVSNKESKYVNQCNKLNEEKDWLLHETAKNRQEVTDIKRSNDNQENPDYLRVRLQELDAERKKLQRELETKNLEIQKCKEEIDKLKKEREELVKQAAKYEGERDEYKEKAEKLEQQLNAEKKELQKDMDKLKQLLSQQDMEWSDFKKILVLYESIDSNLPGLNEQKVFTQARDAEEYRAEYPKDNYKIWQLKKFQRATEKDRKDLDKRVYHDSREIEEIEKSIEDNKTLLSDMMKKSDDYKGKARMGDESSGEVELVESPSNSLELEMDERIREMEVDQQKLSSECTELSTRCERNRKNIKELGELIECSAKMKREVEAASQEQPSVGDHRSVSKDSEYQCLLQQLIKSCLSLEKCEDEHKQCSDALVESREMVAEQKEELEKMNARNEELEGELVEQQQHVQRLKLRTEELGEEVEDLRLENGELSSQVKELSEEVEGLRLENGELCSQAEMLGEEVKGLRLENGELCSQVEMLGKEVKGLKLENGEFCSQVEMLGEEVESLRLQKEELSIQVTAHINHREACRQKNEELQELMRMDEKEFTQMDVNDETEEERVTTHEMLRGENVSFVCLVAIISLVLLYCEWSFTDFFWNYLV